MEIIKQEEVINPASIIGDVQLTATLPQEMVTAQIQLIDWCINKISIERADSEELRLATEHAKKSKWKFSTLQANYYKSVKRVEYYEKIKLALEAGFYIVPNFPIQMFAIRTTSKKPLYGEMKERWNSDFKQDAKELSAEDGEYKNPFPQVFSKTVKVDGIDKTLYYPKDWNDIEFPMTMAKPTIMEATTRAMALKIFDQIGIMPAARKEDPVIIGQIFRKSGYNTKIVSFMIAWHLNTNML